MILFLTKDLMIQSNATAAAKVAGLELRSVANLTTAMEKAVSENVAAILVDLQAPGLVVDSLIVELSKLEKQIPVIAFAQHVEEDLLAAARNGVFDQVLTRGQFFRQLPAIISQLANSDS